MIVTYKDDNHGLSYKEIRMDFNTSVELFTSLDMLRQKDFTKSPHLSLSEQICSLENILIALSNLSLSHYAESICESLPNVCNRIKDKGVKHKIRLYNFDLKARALGYETLIIIEHNQFRISYISNFIFEQMDILNENEYIDKKIVKSRKIQEMSYSDFNSSDHWIEDILNKKIIPDACAQYKVALFKASKKFNIPTNTKKKQSYMHKIIDEECRKNDITIRLALRKLTPSHSYN